jgi:hypothetical protein
LILQGEASSYSTQKDKNKPASKSIKARGLKKEQGCSWMEIRNRVYVFGTGDKCFEQFEEVYKLLGILAGLLAKEGYVANLQFVLHEINFVIKV